MSRRGDILMSNPTASLFSRAGCHLNEVKEETRDINMFFSIPNIKKTGSRLNSRHHYPPLLPRLLTGPRRSTRRDPKHH